MKEKANYPKNNKIDHFLAFRRKAKSEPTIPEMFQRRFHNIFTMENHISPCCCIEYSIVCMFTNYRQVQQIDLKEMKRGKRKAKLCSVSRLFLLMHQDLAKVCASTVEGWIGILIAIMSDTQMKAI